jgi:hypothetical protein
LLSKTVTYGVRDDVFKSFFQVRRAVLGINCKEIRQGVVLRGVLDAVSGPTGCVSGPMKCCVEFHKNPESGTGVAVEFANCGLPAINMPLYQSSRQQVLPV